MTVSLGDQSARFPGPGVGVVDDFDKVSELATDVETNARIFRDLSARLEDLVKRASTM